MLLRPELRKYEDKAQEESEAKLCFFEPTFVEIDFSDKLLSSKQDYQKGIWYAENGTKNGGVRKNSQNFQIT